MLLLMFTNAIADFSYNINSNEVSFNKNFFAEAILFLREAKQSAERFLLFLQLQKNKSIFANKNIIDIQQAIQELIKKISEILTVLIIAEQKKDSKILEQIRKEISDLQDSKEYKIFQKYKNFKINQQALEQPFNIATNYHDALKNINPTRQNDVKKNRNIFYNDNTTAKNKDNEKWPLSS